MPAHDCPDGECWRQIPRAPRYSVSCIGRVRNDGTGRIMRGRLNRVGGYPVVGLMADMGVPRIFLVHRLIYESFVGPIPSGLQVRHLNDRPTHNRLANLEIGTPAENWKDRARNGNHGQKLTEAEAREILALRASGMTYAAIGRRFGVTRAAACHVCLGRRWPHLQAATHAGA